MQRMNNINFNYRNYLFKRLKKLYFLLLFAVVVYQIIYTFHFGEVYNLKNTAIKIVLLGTSVSNFSHTYLYKMISGPFWFFGLMVQLYIVFPMLFKIVKKYNIYLVFSIAFLLIYLLYYFDLNTEFSLFGNIIGHLPEVLLGIFFALNGKIKPTFSLFAISIFTFALSQFYGIIFPLSFVSITIILLFLIQNLKLYCSDFWKNAIVYVGEISMILFIVNGIFRVLSPFSIQDMQLRGERIFVYLILLFIVCHFVFKIYNYLYRKLKI